MEAYVKCVISSSNYRSSKKIERSEDTESDLDFEKHEQLSFFFDAPQLLRLDKFVNVSADDLKERVIRQEGFGRFVI